MRMRVALAGDVMIGRGIDQAQSVSAPPELYEPAVKDARRYIDLAEMANGPFDRPMAPHAPWGAALEGLAELRPDHFFVNLETSLTAGGSPWQEKGIHYRAHPENIDILSAAGVDCVGLANNHILDFGYDGLDDTLRSLRSAGIACSGAGSSRALAARPASLPAAPGKEGAPRIISVGFGNSGIPDAWFATDDHPGVFAFGDVSERAYREIRQLLEGDEGHPTILSIHWGKNWGFRIPEAHRKLARSLAETGLVSAIFGHSSHHPMAIEVHAGVPIIYGAGDLINDYEGIPGHDAYRPDLRLLYAVDFDAGRAVKLHALSLQMRQFRLDRAGTQDTDWLKGRLTDATRAPELRLTPDGVLAGPLS